jgi:predicted Fe-Mo cluster-binding NifX family protein
MGELVAPCFEHCATMAVFQVREDGGLEQTDYPLRSRDPFDRVRLLRDREVDCVICGAVQDLYEDVLRTTGLEVISWVSGFVEELLSLYLRGKLESGVELQTGVGPRWLAMDGIEEA